MFLSVVAVNDPELLSLAPSNWSLSRDDADNR